MADSQSLIHNNIIFVGPLDMVKALAEQAADPAFWATIQFLCQDKSWIPGGLCPQHPPGKPGLPLSPAKELLDPVMLLIKSVPVASFVILALIWIGSRNLAVFTSFLVVVPMVYVKHSVRAEHTDKTAEMAGFPNAMWKASTISMCQPSFPTLGAVQLLA